MPLQVCIGRCSQIRYVWVDVQKSGVYWSGEVIHPIHKSIIAHLMPPTVTTATGCLCAVKHPRSCSCCKSNSTTQVSTCHQASPVARKGLAIKAAAPACCHRPASPRHTTGNPSTCDAVLVWSGLVWKPLPMLCVCSLRAQPCSHRYGLLVGMVNAALEGFLIRGRAPWTLHHRWVETSPDVRHPSAVGGKVPVGERDSLA